MGHDDGLLEASTSQQKIGLAELRSHSLWFLCLCLAESGMHSGSHIDS